MSAKVDLHSFNNNWYKPGSKVKILLWYFCNAAFLMNPLFPFNGFKIFLLKMFGAKIGSNVLIKPSVNIKYPWKLTIGNNCWIGEKVWIDNLDEVVLEANVCISQGALLLCGNHDYKKSTFDLVTKPIHIAEGAWIGANSVVCGGVHVASHAVLTVASVASSNLNAYEIYRGNPAVSIKKREIL